jgi:hypothetical protein
MHHSWAWIPPMIVQRLRRKRRLQLQNRQPQENPVLKLFWIQSWSKASFARLFLYPLFNSKDAKERSKFLKGTQSTQNTQKNADKTKIFFCVLLCNVGKLVNQGVEFTIRSNPLSILTIDANYTFLNRNISGASNMVKAYPTGTAKHRAVGTASLRLPHKASVSASMINESGAFTINDAATIFYPASKFATVDLGGIIPIYAGMSNIQ